MLAVFLLASVFSACSGGKDPAEGTSVAGGTSGTQASTQAQAGDGYTLPLANGDASINCWGFPLPDWKVDNLEDNQFTKWLEEQTGVNLIFTMGPATDRDTKLRLLLSSGEYPEVIFNPGFTPSEQQIYGNSGVILQLNDYIDKYGIETGAMFEKVPEIRQAVEREGGKIYVLPSYLDSPHDKSYSRLWVYQPWLDALGIKAPSTTEEYYDMLIRFRDGDPNKNGKKDEIPYVGAEQVWFSDPTTYFMNSFIYYDNNTFMNIDNGKVIPVYTQEQYREGLRFLNRLYAANLMMPQTFSQNDQALKQLLSSDPMIVGSFTAHAPFVYCDEPVYSKLTPLAPLKGPGGVQYTCQYYNTSTDGTVITNKCKNPELAFKLLDYLYNVEVTTRKSQGPEGVAWKWNTDKSLVNEYGLTPSWLVLQSSEEQAPNDRWALLGNYFQPNERSGIYSMNMTKEAIEAREKNTGKVDGYVQIQKAAMDVYNNYFPDNGIRMPQVLMFSEDESATLGDVELALKNKIIEMRTRFITGNASLDTDWDAYIEDLKSIGMEQVLELYQKAYERR